MAERSFYYEYEGQTLTYTVLSEEDKTVTVAACLGNPTGGLKIPSTVTQDGTSFTVTEIGEEAFYYRSNLTSIEIPATVTTIGPHAFFGTGLTSVTIPASVTSIGSAFFRCDELKEIIFKDGNTPLNLTWETFWQSDNIETVYLGRELNYGDSDSPFDDREALKTLTIGNSLTVLNTSFYRCPNLTSVTLGNSLTTIGNSVFGSCMGLTSVDFPESITEIGDGAFSWCMGLTSLAFPESITEIGNGAFSGCSGLTSVVLPNSITNIAEFVFSDCSNISSVKLGNSVTTIGAEAFYNCENLRSINLPETLTEIGEGAFYNCKLTSVNISNSVTKIGEYSFNGCSELSTLTLGNSVKEIGAKAFDSCSSLTSLTLPNSVTKIGEKAFNGCSSLETLKICEGVTEIGEWAFGGGDKLKEVYYASSNPVPGSNNIFSTMVYLNKEAKLYVPVDALDRCKAIDPWKNFQNIEAYDFNAGIEAILGDFDENAPCEIFTLGGMRMAGGLDGLIPGVYVVRQGGNVNKIVIR